jgi:predicted RNase H-like nuclease
MATGPAVAGVDGVADRWVAAVLVGGAVGGSVSWRVGSAVEVLAVARACAAVAVDIPIGLVRRGQRSCEAEVREILRRDRSSIFATPPQPAFAVGRTLGTDRSARAVAQAAAREAGGQGISTQSWGIAAKILEVEDAVRGAPELAGRIVETHPETAFRVMGGGSAASAAWPGKRSAAGVARRMHALSEAMGADIGWLADPVLDRVPVDDALDALAAAWTATRVAAGTAVTFGADQAAEAVWSDGSPAPGRAVIVV